MYTPIEIMKRSLGKGSAIMLYCLDLARLTIPLPHISIPLPHISKEESNGHFQGDTGTGVCMTRGKVEFLK